MEKLRQEIFTIHDIEVNQKYNDTLPYSFHLKLVEAQFNRFKHLLETPTQVLNCRIAVWGHDLMEDARMTYNNVKSLYGKYGFRNNNIEEIIFLCTDFKGRTREDRKPKQFYTELFDNKEALFVKLCDMIANKYFSCMTNSSMKDKYNKEYGKFKNLCYYEPYKEMFDLLEKLD